MSEEEDMRDEAPVGSYYEKGNGHGLTQRELLVEMRGDIKLLLQRQDNLDTRFQIHEGLPIHPEGGSRVVALELRVDEERAWRNKMLGSIAILAVLFPLAAGYALEQLFQ